MSAKSYKKRRKEIVVRHWVDKDGMKRKCSTARHTHHAQNDGLKLGSEQRTSNKERARGPGRNVTIRT